MVNPHVQREEGIKQKGQYDALATSGAKSPKQITINDEALALAELIYDIFKDQNDKISNGQNDAQTTQNN